MKPDIFGEEMYSKTFEILDNVVQETCEELSTYRDILEISDRVKKSEPERDFGKETRDSGDFSGKSEANIKGNY